MLRSEPSLLSTHKSCSAPLCARQSFTEGRENSLVEAPERTYPGKAQCSVWKLLALKSATELFLRSCKQRQGFQTCRQSPVQGFNVLLCVEVIRVVVPSPYSQACAFLQVLSPGIMATDWLGSIVSINCGESLGVYQGRVSAVDQVSQTISLTRPFHNGVKCLVPEVTFRLVVVFLLRLPVWMDILGRFPPETCSLP